jgi:acyl-coenzyme A thioesterase PaaI-like protein
LGDGVHEDEGAHFIGGLGLVQGVRDEVWTGTVRVPPGALVPGTGVVRPAVLLTYADVVAGTQASRRTHPRVSVTVDLSLEVLRRPRSEDLALESRILRSGARVTVGETVFFADGDPAPFAVAQATFMASPREVDLLPEGGRQHAAWQLTTPLADHVGLAVPAPGVAELARRKDLDNASDSLQGGLIGLLAEVAAETLASATASRPFIVRRLDVQYLAAVRVGPGRATASILRADAHSATLRVAIHDPGRDNRLTSLVMVECVPIGEPA